MLLKNTTPESLPNIFPVDLWDLREQRRQNFSQKPRNTQNKPWMDWADLVAVLASTMPMTNLLEAVARTAI